MMEQLKAAEHHKEMEKNSWMGLFKKTAKPQKKKPDGSTRKLVSTTAAKFLRKAGLRKEGDVIDATHGRNKAIDILQARKQKRNATLKKCCDESKWKCERRNSKINFDASAMSRAIRKRQKNGKSRKSGAKWQRKVWKS